MKIPPPIPENEEDILDRYALLAAAQGVVLVGVKDALGPGYSVEAFSGDTQTSLGVRLPITEELAYNHERLLSALDCLVIEALGKLVPK